MGEGILSFTHSKSDILIAKSLGHCRVGPKKNMSGDLVSQEVITYKFTKINLGYHFAHLYYTIKVFHKLGQNSYF